MFLSVFFSRPKVAISVASVYYVVQYIIVLAIRDKSELIPSQTIWVGLVPTAYMALTFTGLIFANSNGVVVTLANLNSVVLNVNLSGFFIITPAISFGYVLLLWYCEQVVPNDFGPARHPLFFLGCQKNEKREKPEGAETS
jgi:hypothetical protein